MVTVVDGYNFNKNLTSIETYKEEVRIGKTTKMEEVPVAQLFIDQIEFSNVIIINKLDLITKEQLEAVEHLIKRLNPTAEIIHSTNAQVDYAKILNTKKFDFEEAQNTDKWIEELAKTPSSEVDEYGFSSFAYKRRKPFNPRKLFDLMSKNVFKDVVRAKGYIWIATNPYICGMLNVVGDIKTLEPQTMWWAAVRKSKWGKNKQEIEMVQKAVESVWEPEYGDRRIELVFIGQTHNREAIVNALDECLLTDEEFAIGYAKWVKMFEDPFVEWQEAVKNHPLKADFKEISIDEEGGEWEDDDDDSDFVDEESLEEEKK